MNENFDVDEFLEHHGIKGQKWGIRRFQNKDGSLTKAGGKRYNGPDYKPRKSEKESASKVASAVKSAGSKTVSGVKAAGKATIDTGKKVANSKGVKLAKTAHGKLKDYRLNKKLKKEAEAAEQRRKDVDSGKLSAKQMTTEEINRRMERLNLEKRYAQLLKETNPADPTVEKGKKFISKMWDEAIAPAATEATKSLVKDALIKQGAKKLGLNDDAANALDKKVKEWQNKQTISNAKKQIYDNERHMNDDNLPSLKDRQTMMQHPELLSETERRKYEAQDWFKESNRKKYKKNSDKNNGKKKKKQSTN